MKGNDVNFKKIITDAEEKADKTIEVNRVMEGIMDRFKSAIERSPHDLHWDISFHEFTSSGLIKGIASFAEIQNVAKLFEKWLATYNLQKIYVMPEKGQDINSNYHSPAKIVFKMYKRDFK